MKRFVQVLKPILFSIVLVFSLSGIAHGGKMVQCSDEQLPLLAQGIDYGFKCLCIVKNAPKRHQRRGPGTEYFEQCEKFSYYKQWWSGLRTDIVDYSGCKGYCIDTPEWQAAVSETDALMDSCSAIMNNEPGFVFKRLNACKVAEWGPAY